MRAAAAGRALCGVAVLGALGVGSVATTGGAASARPASPAVFAAAPARAPIEAAASNPAVPDRWEQTGSAAPARRLAALRAQAGDALARSTARAGRGSTRTPVPAARWVRPSTGRLTSPFGHRWGRLHAGIDLAAGYGSPIRAAANGVVVFAGPRGGYGQLIVVRHPGGLTTRYGHMSAILVRSGPVRAGQVIAREGAAGDATGPHLHFEVRLHRTTGAPDRATGADVVSAGTQGVDVPVDPLWFLARHGVLIKR